MARSQRVLVVDDEPRVREVVVAYLERDGFRVTDVASVEAARAQLDGLDPDLVILDVMLPAESGLDLLADLRQGGDTPVILLTEASIAERHSSVGKSSTDDSAPSSTVFAARGLPSSSAIPIASSAMLCPTRPFTSSTLQSG